MGVYQNPPKPPWLHTWAVKAIKKLFRPGEPDQQCKQNGVFNYHPQTDYADGHEDGYRSGAGGATLTQRILDATTEQVRTEKLNLLVCAKN